MMMLPRILLASLLLAALCTPAFAFAPDFILTHNPRYEHTTTILNIATVSNSETDYKVATVPILEANKPLSSFSGSSASTGDCSILSWNILLPNGQDNWWNHKMYAPWVPMKAREWPHRQGLIQKRLLDSHADIICIQEADGDTFEQDFAFLTTAGYSHVLHKKFRFRCATFFKSDKFTLESEAHKDRVLVTALRSTLADDNNRLVHVINCHLSGGAAPERRLRQVHEGVDQIRKWKTAAAQRLLKLTRAKRKNLKNVEIAQQDHDRHENAGVVVCGDFNSDGNTGVRKFLVDGSVEPDWREPQYSNVRLTSKIREHEYFFLDAAELAYGANVCDGDYGEEEHALGCRPATYVVPNLASILLMPIDEDNANSSGKTNFGTQVARGIAETLGLDEWCQHEIDSAFRKMDLDGNGVVDKYEVEKLLEVLYLKSKENYKAEEAKRDFFGRFWESTGFEGGLTKRQVSERLLALHQELHGGSKGSELVQVQTEADVEAMVGRFTPLLRDAIDFVFDTFSTTKKTLSREQLSEFLIETNGELGRGGTWRHSQEYLDRKSEVGAEPAHLTRGDFYGIFARELAEGKWWQVVYDLETCGATIRRTTHDCNMHSDRAHHYQGWLDYMYFDSHGLVCEGYQDALTQAEFSRIYHQGDALPNEWHPSDHLPIAALFSWR